MAQSTSPQPLPDPALVRLLQVAAVAANGSTRVEDALQTCLAAVGEHTGWQAGHQTAGVRELFSDRALSPEPGFTVVKSIEDFWFTIVELPPEQRP